MAGLSADPWPGCAKSLAFAYRGQRGGCDPHVLGAVRRHGQSGARPTDADVLPPTKYSPPTDSMASATRSATDIKSPAWPGSVIRARRPVRAGTFAERRFCRRGALRGVLGAPLLRRAGRAVECQEWRSLVRSRTNRGLERGVRVAPGLAEARSSASPRMLSYRALPSELSALSSGRPASSRIHRLARAGVHRRLPVFG